MNSPKPKPIADVQSSADTRHLAINRVGMVTKMRGMYA